MGKEFSVLGKRLPRIESLGKATGEAIYTIDIKRPGMLHGKILKSPHPHAKILNIDTRRAEKIPGVKGIITCKDFGADKKSSHNYGAFIPDEYPLAFDRVRYIGDEVAAVAALDEDCAQEALELIQVEYEPLPAVYDPEEAIKEGAPQIHEHAKNNISWRLFQDRGDVDALMESADHIQADRFVTQAVCHSPLEPHAAVAEFDPNGSLTIWSSTQKPFFVSWDLALALGIPESKVRTIKPNVGGGFGGKLETAPNDFCAAFLARKTGRPVRIVLTRDEEFMTSRRRHPFIFELKTGVKKDGTILARSCRSILDGGSYNSVGVVTCYLSAIFLNMPYRSKGIRYEALRVYTNNTPSGAMRGFGAPQTHFAVDVQMDMIAEALGMDPMELRLKNALKAGEETPSGAKIKSSALSETIRSAAELGGWSARRLDLKGVTGLGMACNGFLSGPRARRLPRQEDAYAFSATILRAHGDGRVTLITGSADIGQGSDSTMAMIAAEELGISLDCVSVIAGDTEIAPLDLGTYGSRVTMMAGNATLNAASNLKDKILDAVASEMEIGKEDLVIVDDLIQVKGSPRKKVTFSEGVIICQKAIGGKPVIGEGYYNPEFEGVLDRKALCEQGVGNYAPTYSFGTHLSQVEVDRETGEVTVKRVIASHDGGVAINPMSVEGQLEGSVSMGHGYAMTEEAIYDDGLMLNPNFLEYKLPLSVDSSPIDVRLHDSDDPEGPFGAKEAGEGPVSPTAPSIVNAIHNATGVWIKELPVDPEKILKAMKK